jgi:hypothetical protein
MRRLRRNGLVTQFGRIEGTVLARKPDDEPCDGSTFCFVAAESDLHCSL